ncbi:MAG: hypothetical protein K5866_09825 [Treponema sp.]|nr:hypothetical protein [Treponema sp.]
MKKLLSIAAVLLAASMIFVGCSNGVAEPTSNNSSSDSNSTETTDKVVWENADGEKITTQAYSKSISLDKVVDLTGYKYLNFEVASEGNVDGQKVIVQPMNEQNGGGHPQGLVENVGKLEKKIIQTKFGTTYGEYTDWSTGSAVVKTIEDDNLGSFQIYVQQTVSPWGTVDGVEVTLYKVTATNTELK